MSHKFEPKNMNKLDNEWRRQNLPPHKTMQQLGLSKADVVADIGCGIGYFTIPIAQSIERTNKVYALDTSIEMLAEVEKRAANSEIKNIITLKTDEYDLKLPDNTVNFSLLVNVLHEIDDKELFIGEIKRIIKENGKIAIIEWEKKQTQMGPSIEHRLDIIDVKILLEKLGFEIMKQTTFADCFYGVVGVVK